MYRGTGGPIATEQLDFIILKHMELLRKVFGIWQVFKGGNPGWKCRVRGF